MGIVPQVLIFCLMSNPSSKKVRNLSFNCYSVVADRSKFKPVSETLGELKAAIKAEFSEATEIRFNTSSTYTDYAAFSFEIPNIQLEADSDRIEMVVRPYAEKYGYNGVDYILHETNGKWNTAITIGMRHISTSNHHSAPVLESNFPQ